MSGDFEIERGLLLGSLGNSVARFVRETGLTELSISIQCDVPDAVFAISGESVGVPVIRIYVDGLSDDEE